MFYHQTIIRTSESKNNILKGRHYSIVQKDASEVCNEHTDKETYKTYLLIPTNKSMGLSTFFSDLQHIL